MQIASLMLVPANAWRVGRADPKIVDRYVRLLRFTEPPPIVVDGNFVLDGIRRLAAALKAGRVEIATKTPKSKR